MADLSALSDADLDRMIQEKSAAQKTATDLSSISDEELDQMIASKQKAPKKEAGQDSILGIPISTIEGALDSFPVAGAVFGGALGTPADVVTGPAGTLVGAGLGAAGGKALANAIRAGLSLDSAPETRSEIYGQPLKEGLMGAAGEGAGQILSKAPGLLRKAPGAIKSLIKGEAEAVGETLPQATFKDVGFIPTAKSNAEEIAQASKRIGGEATPGMLSANQNIQNLENVLKQQPGLTGERVRKLYDPIEKGLSESAENLAGNPALTPYEAGEQFKTGALKKISEKAEPLSAHFESIRGASKYIRPSSESLNRAADRLLKQDMAEFANLPQGQAIQKYANMIRGAKSLDSLKQLRSSVGDEMGKALDSGDGQLAMALGKVKGAIQRLERREILKSAIEAMPTKAQGEAAAKELIGEIKTVNKGWRSLMGELESVAKAGGIKKISSPGHLARIIDNMPSEKIADRFFNTKNFKGLKDVKTYLPEEFEILRQNKLGQIAEKSLTKGEPDPVKLVRNLKSIGKESRELLFGKDGERVLGDMETVLNSMPSKVGASDTPRGVAWFSFANSPINPKNWAHEAQGAYNYMLLSGKSPTIAASRSLPKMLPRAGGYALAGSLSTRDLRGRDKWASDGLEKLRAHMGGDDAIGAIIDPLNASPKVRELLIKASDLKPGSRAMDNLLKQINKEFGGKE